jgi:hypothetical protein
VRKSRGHTYILMGFMCDRLMWSCLSICSASAATRPPRTISRWLSKFEEIIFTMN